MLCAISGNVPKDAVVSRKSGHVFEKALVTKIIKEIGLCPVTNEPLSLDDLVEVAAPSVLAGVKPAAAGSIPSLLAALQSEYDASALETYSLRKTLQETRQELSQTLYQLDAATRVVARVVRERDEYRRLAEEGGGGGGGVTSDAGKPHSNAGKKKAAPADGGPAKKKVKTSGGLPEQAAEDLQATSKSLMSSRKSRTISPTIATPDDLKAIGLQATHAPHDKRKGGGGILGICAAPTDASMMLTAGADGVAHVVNIASGDVVATLKEGGHTKKISAIRPAGAGSCVTASAVDGTVRLWDIEKASCRATFKHAGVISIDMHPSNGFTKYLYATTPGAWSITDVGSGDTLVTVDNSDPSHPYTAAALHPDGLVYATGAQNGTITLWESRSQTVAGTVTADGGNSIVAIAFSENGYHMASVDSDGVKIWDLRKLSCIHQLAAEGAEAAAYDQSGLFLAVGTATAAAVYGVKQKYEKLVEVGDLPKKGAHAVAFGPDAKSLVVGASDLRVYKAA